jgi:hypothetical protein
LKTFAFPLLWLTALLICSYTRNSLAQDQTAHGHVEVSATPIVPGNNPVDCNNYKLLQDIEDARTKWRSFGIKDYSYSVDRIAYTRIVGWPTDSPLVITVRNGLVSVASTELPDSLLQTLSVEGQFEALESEFLRGPDCIQATFDETFGFTSSMYVDPRSDETDDEVKLVFTNFGS